MGKSCRRFARQRARDVIYSTPTHPAINFISPLISFRSSYVLRGCSAANPEQRGKGGREGTPPASEGPPAGRRPPAPFPHGARRGRGVPPGPPVTSEHPPAPLGGGLRPAFPPRPSQAFPRPLGGTGRAARPASPTRNPAPQRRPPPGGAAKAPLPEPGPVASILGPARRGALLTCMPGTCTATGEWAMAGCGGRAPPAAPLSRPPCSWAAAGPGRTKRQGGGGFSAGRAPSFPPRGPPCPAAPARRRLTSRPRGWGRAARRGREKGVPSVALPCPPGS